MGLRIIQSVRGLGQSVWPVSSSESEDGLLLPVVTDGNLENLFPLRPTTKAGKTCSIHNLKAMESYQSYEKLLG